jgi:hypothetical protein
LRVDPRATITSAPPSPIRPLRGDSVRPRRSLGQDSSLARFGLCGRSRET